MEAYSPKDNITWILCTRQQIDKKRGAGYLPAPLKVSRFPFR